VSNEKQDQEKISAIINAVLQGTITKELADALVDCIKQSATTDPCDAVILGCTELSVINHYFPLDTYLSDQKITIIDPLKIAAKYILNITYT
jgi:aspartate/glutamate racemase